LIITCDFIIHNSGYSVRFIKWEQVFSDQNNSDSSWSCIFLSTSINTSKLGEINGPWAKIATHITYKSKSFRVWHCLMFNSHYGFIICVMNISSIFIYSPILIIVIQTHELFLLKSFYIMTTHYFSIFLTLLHSFFSPCSINSITSFFLPIH
jgi:hypothetical protein